jgi:uncharacterized membrane protein YccC
MGPTRQALRGALTLDTTLLTPVAALLTAVPVVAIYAVGYATLGAAPAVAMAVGANLVAVVSLIAAPRLPLRLAVANAFVMGGSVLLGTATATTPWLHLVVLVPWCLLAGLALAYGQTVGAIGSQALIAYVILGRFAGPAAVDLRLAAEVTGGALVEVLALVVLRLPPCLRHQRTNLAAALEAVADLAEEDPRRSAIEVLTTVDAAERVLSAPALFGRVDVGDLRSVLDQVRRTRLEITTLAGLRVRLAEEGVAVSRQALRDAGAATAEALRALAAALDPTRPTAWKEAVDAQRRATRALDLAGVPDQAAVLVGEARSRLEAIGGQLRATGQMVDDLRRAERLRTWRPRLTGWVTTPAEEITFEPALLRRALHPASPTFRHAVRLAVAVPVAALLAQWWGLPRGYWLPFAVVVVLRPDYSTLYSRGIGRVIGTLVGAVGAALVVSALHPDPALNTFLVALFAWLSYATWSAGFSASVAAMTALILTLLTSGSADPFSTALDRLLEVSLGAVIAWLAYLVWPTPPRAGVVAAQQHLFDSLADYLDQVRPVLLGAPSAPTVMEASRRARVAWATAESAVGRSVQEPASTRLDPREGRSLLVVAMRILRATHALRLDVDTAGPMESTPEVEALLVHLEVHVRSLGAAVGGEPTHSGAKLREDYLAAEPLLEAASREGMLAHLDELVNAVNTGAELIESYA